MKLIVEVDPDGWKSTEYSKYKPYAPAPKRYNWKDYCTLSDDGMKILSCHMCDIRKTGCSDSVTPRYYCKKDKRERQSSLFEFVGSGK